MNLIFSPLQEVNLIFSPLQDVNLIATLEDLGHFESELGNSTEPENQIQKRLAERVLR